MKRILFLGLIATLALPAAEWQEVALEASQAGVQPGCGVVLWSDHEHVTSDAVQLEFSYLRYDAIAVAAEPERWDWTPVERLLAAAAARHHQVIIRLHDTYPGEARSGAPAWITNQPGYRDTVAASEGKPTGFPDWGCAAWQDLAIEVHRRMAMAYDHDPRLAAVEAGFGLWAEYHIYDGPMQLGRTFPDHAYQRHFLTSLAACWQATPWLISIDAADRETAPVAADPALLALPFGCFDDSFLAKEHPTVNARNWAAMDATRWQRAMCGGEFSYYNNRDQKLALSAAGPHGDPFPAAAARFHLSWIIGSDQPRHAGLEAVRQAGRVLGYRFRVASIASDRTSTRVEVVNDGIAPIYQDAWPARGGVRSPTSLRTLLPGERRTCIIPAASGGFSIASDRLSPGQTIGWTR